MGQVLEIVASGGQPSVWSELRREAERAAIDEPGLASLLNAAILSHAEPARALSYQLARKLADGELGAMALREAIEEATPRTRV